MTSLTDILTALKSGVVGISNASQQLSYVVPTYTSATVTAKTLITTGKGRVYNVAVVVAGSTVGSLYNADGLPATAVGNVLYSAPNTIGVYSFTQVFTNGLVLEPGTGQSLNVTYSKG